VRFLRSERAAYRRALRSGSEGTAREAMVQYSGKAGVLKWRQEIERLARVEPMSIYGGVGSGRACVVQVVVAEKYCPRAR